MKKENILNENEIELDNASAEDHVIDDPNVIHINDNDYERVKDHDEDEDKEENFFERFFGKRPSEKALRKLSIASFILGVLSCSLLLGNLITSVLGILLALKNEKHKYRSSFSTAGFILSVIGLILGVTITGIIVLISVAMIIAISLMIVILLILLLVLVVLLILVMLFGIGVLGAVVMV